MEDFTGLDICYQNTKKTCLFICVLVIRPNLLFMVNNWNNENQMSYEMLKSVAESPAFQ